MADVQSAGVAVVAGAPEGFVEAFRRLAVAGVLGALLAVVTVEVRAVLTAIGDVTPLQPVTDRSVVTERVVRVVVHDLRRAITDEDVEMLLGIRIRRISRFDLEKNRKDIEKLLDELITVEKHLEKLRAYVISYLRGLLKTYGKHYPRRTQITSFDQVEVKELAAGEYKIAYDRENGYLGYQTEGDPMLECSRYDKILLVWSDGRYKVIRPPEKLFVDKNLLYCASADREQVFTMVYRHDLFVFLKRFTFGGAITDREYQCAKEPSTVLIFEEGTPEHIYVKYKPSKRQRIHQQHFTPADVPIKGVKAMGNHMTGKAIARIDTGKGRWWKEDEDSPRGRFS